MPTTQILLEAKPKEFKKDLEKKLKKRLLALLRDDGKGHHHARYADRLELLDVQIVPLSVDPYFTAAIYYDLGLIRISEGFLNDPSTFYQLHVLIRHELAHLFLSHQIRMANKLGEEMHLKTQFSASLHRLINIIADDEISNRKYSDEDKIIVRNMVLNGRVIGGLVTEDHKEDWIHLSIEEMHERLEAEIEKISAQIKSGRSMKSITAETEGDLIATEILKTYIYTDIDSGSIIQDTLKDFIDKGCPLEDGKLQGSLRELAENIYKRLDGEVLSDDEVRKLLKKIAVAAPTENLDIFDDGSVYVYSPEEKYVAVEVLKKYKSEYAEWYDKVISTLKDDFSEEELEELLSVLK
jgi:hypothetical protein